MHLEHRIAKSDADPAQARALLQESLLLRIVVHWKLFLAVFVAVLMTAVLLLLVLPKSYVAMGSVIVAEPETSLSLPPAGWAQKVGDPADVESQLLIIKSARILQKVAALPDVLALIQQECTLGSLRRESICSNLDAASPELLDYLEQQYSVNGAGRSRVINISFKSNSPTVARDMANALITTFLEDHRANLSGGRDVAASEIRAQLQALDTEITALDRKIERFRRERGLTSGSQAPISSERLSAIAHQLSLAEADRVRAESDLREAESDIGRSVPGSPLLLSNLSISGIRQQIMAVDGEEQALSSSLGPRHPRIRTLKVQETYLRDRLKTEIQVVIDGARKQVESAELRVGNLERDMAQARSEVSRATTDESSIEQMVRDVEVKRRQYGERSEQLNTLVTEQQATLGSTRLVSFASLPIKAFFPKTLPFLVGGGLLATILATFAALLADVAMELVGRFRNRKTEVLPVLARLPLLGDLQGTSGFEAVEAQANDDHRFRAELAPVDAAINNLSRDNLFKGVVVTSLFADENSSYLALALARFATTKGRKVLLVETDFHNPQLSRLLGHGHRRQGLWDLATNPDLEPDRLPIDYHGIDVVVAGNKPSHQDDLAFDSFLSPFLLWAERYDLVLFDCPPIAGHMESILLARDMNGILLSAHDSVKAQALLADTAARLGKLGVQVHGACLWERDFVSTPGNQNLFKWKRFKVAS